MSVKAPFTKEGLLAFHSWTHACLAVLLSHAAVVPQSLYVREIEGFGLPSMRDQFAHLFECEVRWVHRAQGIPFAGFLPDQFPSVQAARALRDQAVDGTLAYFSTLTDDSVNKTVPVRVPEQEEPLMRTPAELLHHVLSHAFHHKGTIVAMCRTLGYPVPNNDLIWLVGSTG